MFFWMFLWIMIILSIGTTPVWPHSRRWGYYPTSGLSFVLIVFLCLWMFGMFGSYGHQGWWGGTPAPITNR